LDDVERQKLAARIELIAKAIGTKAKAAKIANVSVQQLHNITTGKSAPSFSTVAKLSTESGYDLNWVWTGEGEPRRANAPSVPVTPPLIDARFFGRLTSAIAKAYSEAGVILGTTDLGRLAAIEYQQLAFRAFDENEQIQEADRVRDKHSRMLANESLAERKRGA
jgi:hypothetical protein